MGRTVQSKIKLALHDNIVSIIEPYLSDDMADRLHEHDVAQRRMIAKLEQEVHAKK